VKQFPPDVYGKHSYKVQVMVRLGSYVTGPDNTKLSYVETTHTVFIPHPYLGYINNEEANYQRLQNGIFLKCVNGYSHNSDNP
jgi:hypothetical protein